MLNIQVGSRSTRCRNLRLRASGSTLVGLDQIAVGQGLLGSASQTLRAQTQPATATIRAWTTLLPAEPWGLVLPRGTRNPPLGPGSPPLRSSSSSSSSSRYAVQRKLCLFSQTGYRVMPAMQCALVLHVAILMMSVPKR